MKRRCWSTSDRRPASVSTRRTITICSLRQREACSWACRCFSPWWPTASAPRRERRRTRRACTGFRAGALCGLVGVAVQSVWETGLTAPANAVLAALAAAIAVHPAEDRRRGRPADMSLRIGFDVDGVLADFRTAFREAAVRCLRREVDDSSESADTPRRPDAQGRAPRLGVHREDAELVDGSAGVRAGADRATLRA